MMNLYKQMEEKRQDRINNFDMIFAFDDKTLEKGIAKLNVNSKDELLSIGLGGFIRKADKLDYIKMIKEINKEKETMINTNDKYVFEMFKYEMANHEYIISYDDLEILETCNIKEETFKNDDRLKDLYSKAKNEYLNEAE